MSPSDQSLHSSFVELSALTLLSKFDRHTQNHQLESMMTKFYMMCAECSSVLECDIVSLYFTLILIAIFCVRCVVLCT